MNDWAQQWQDEQEGRVSRRVERAEMDLDDLADRWVRLAGMVAATGSTADGSRGVAGPTVPIRVDVVDLQRDIASFVARVVPLARGALRAGFSNRCSTVGGLGYLRSNMRSIWTEDPATGEEVARDAGKLRWRARRIAGEVSSAFALDVVCPACGYLALWAHPGRGLVRCGMAECGSEWVAADLAVEVWRSGV